jgi:hypothetical protein
LLNVKTFTWHAHNSIGVLLHVEQLDNFVDVGQFFCLWDSLWLPEESGEI